MWFELIIGIVIFQLLRRFFSSGDDLDVGTYNDNALFSVAKRLEKIYGGKVYVGLRIPDIDSGSPKNIDLVIVTHREAVIISVKNVSGFVSIDKDQNWVCMGVDKHKEECFPDPVAETKQLVPILESYLEQRGLALPEGYLSCKVICSNPNFRTIHGDSFPPEVLTYDQWRQLKPEKDSVVSSFIKGAFKKEMKEPIQENLNSILSTAPMWDRLELKSNKRLLGDFVEFKGDKDDIFELRNIKRSKVSRVTIQKTSMFGLAHSKLQVLYWPRDYQGEGASGFEWNEVCVRSSTEVVFQPRGSTKVRKYKLSSVISMSLSA
ncbi:unnamed protein product [Cuscuta campestris]|uniref:NERD domain-containing protein n=1 Tax=Cuscuta campestris TaxID=132261 RepID=A0A484NQA9_9ASTE|nr:unnamed protein product [Cuscuta campestris]